MLNVNCLTHVHIQFRIFYILTKIIKILSIRLFVQIPTLNSNIVFFYIYILVYLDSLHCYWIQNLKKPLALHLLPIPNN
jgi:hypothetical protein